MRAVVLLIAIIAGPYEACSSECDACSDGGICTYPIPVDGANWSNCSYECEVDDDCPPSPYGEPFNAWCQEGLCWLECDYEATDPDDMCPPGLFCVMTELPKGRCSPPSLMPG